MNKSVVYHGPHVDGVVIPYGLGEIAAPHGVPVEVPDEIYESLLDQPSNFKPANTAKQKAAYGHDEAADGPKEVIDDE